jgi:hypothetical protein
MSWVLFIFLLPVIAWGMWLLFCYAIAKMYGVEALKAAPPIAKAFPVSAWVASLRHIGPWLMEVTGRNQHPPPPSGPPP